MTCEKNKVNYMAGKFCGVVSSSVNSLETGALKSLIIELLKEKGCLIYVYNSQEDLEYKKRRLEAWGLNCSKLIKDNRIIYISSKENYFHEGEFHENKILKFYTNLIDQCKENGWEKIIILGRRDRFYNEKVSLQDMVQFHKNIKILCREKEIMGFETYIMDTFTEDSFFKLMPIHDMFILDNEKQSYIYFLENFQKIRLLFKFLRSIFIDKAELYKENKKLELLNKLIMRVSYKHSEGELFNEALKTVSEIVEIDFGYIVKLDNKNILNIIAECNLPQGFREMLTEIRGDREELDELYKRRSEEVKVKITYDSQEPIRKRIIKKYNIKTVIEIPIQEKNKGAISAIVLFSTKKQQAFDKHIPFLKTVSNTILALLNKHEESNRHKKEIIKSEKLKNLGELSGGVAHDFNNVLTAILGFSRVALDKIKDEEVKGYLDIIYKSALDGKSIVNKIQSFNKKRTNRTKESVNLNFIVESGIQMARPKWKNSYESKGIKLELIRELDSKGYINCNEHEIRESILNIILNAMDAMEDGGRLIVKTYDKEEKIYIEIEDTGIGMTEEVREQIFEPFYSTKESRGTGLGLSISKDIIEEHSGKIEVISEYGVGTKFIIELAKHYGNNIVEKKVEVIPNFDNISSLVVDDRVQVAKSVNELLGMLKVKSDIETNSEAVEDKIAKKHYDVIFCDLAMPKLSGLDLAKKIKGNYPKIKFILMTGWPEDIKEEYLDKVDFILEKPCMLEDLTNALEKVKK